MWKSPHQPNVPIRSKRSYVPVLVGTFSPHQDIKTRPRATLLLIICYFRTVAERKAQHSCLGPLARCKRTPPSQLRFTRAVYCQSPEWNYVLQRDITHTLRACQVLFHAPLRYLKAAIHICAPFLLLLFPFLSFFCVLFFFPSHWSPKKKTKTKQKEHVHLKSAGGADVGSGGTRRRLLPRVSMRFGETKKINK